MGWEIQPGPSAAEMGNPDLPIYCWHPFPLAAVEIWRPRFMTACVLLVALAITWMNIKLLVNFSNQSQGLMVVAPN